MRLVRRRFVTGPPQRSRRHRVIDNLLGDAKFCPTVRRTPELDRFVKSSLRDEVLRILNDFDEDAVRRAVSYLFTKETRSSFDIEGEKPGPARTERFVALLRGAAELQRITPAELIRLQNATVDERFANSGWRTDQVYVGDQVDLARQRIHYVAPQPADVGALMDGLLILLAKPTHRIARSPSSAVSQKAAVVAAGPTIAEGVADRRWCADIPRAAGGLFADLGARRAAEALTRTKERFTHTNAA